MRLHLSREIHHHHHHDQQANVRNLSAQQGFEKITAPFTGVITTRSLDQGALIASGGGSGVSIYTEVQSNILRVYINVPQAYFANINVGQEVKYPPRNIRRRCSRVKSRARPMRSIRLHAPSAWKSSFLANRASWYRACI